MYINKRILAGNLGADARQFPATNTGKVKFTFSTAQSRNFRKSDGTYGEITEWTDCVLWVGADRVESYAKRLTKGAQVYIEGRHDIVKRDVNGEQKTFHEINVQELQFLSRPHKTGTDSADTPASSSEQVPRTAEQEHADAFRPASFAP